MIRLFLSAILIVFASCNEPGKRNPQNKSDNSTLTSAATEKTSQKANISEPTENPIIIRSSPLLSKGHETDDTLQVSQYIRRIFQDRNGNLWFGTVTDGALCYDGKFLTYFTPKEGFSGWGVQSIVEDKEGNLWFGTSGGISRYDGRKFTNFTEKEGLNDNHVLSMLIDKTGTLWVGTSKGVSKLSSETFTSFLLPASSSQEIKSITEDNLGNIYFATNGGGAFRYDGNNLTGISKKDGLSSNVVNCVLADRNGNIWFASKEGLSCYNTTKLTTQGFTNFTTRDGLGNNDAWNLYEDKVGNIWVSVRGSICRYNKNSFTTFGPKDGLTNVWVQSYYEDRAGNFWLGSSQGLFLFDGKSFTNITKRGPWPRQFR